MEYLILTLHNVYKINVYVYIGRCIHKYNAMQKMHGQKDKMRIKSFESIVSAFFNDYQNLPDDIQLAFCQRKHFTVRISNTLLESRLKLSVKSF